MTYLLDTHVVIWASEANPRLSKKAQQVMTEEGNRVVFSAASAWELAIKVNLKKIQLGRSLDELIQAMDRSGYEHLPVHRTHVIATMDLPMHHKDPFDRLLAAQAKVEGMTLVSADPVFKKYGIKTLW